jgi:hypothetical protein
LGELFSDLIAGIFDNCKIAIFFDALGNLFLEFPAGHLAGLQLPRKLVRGNFRTSANGVGNFESVCQWNFTPVKNGVRRGRFVVFTFGATPRKG